MPHANMTFEGPSAPLRVLVVDDEPLIGRSLCRYLSSIGFEAHHCLSGGEGLKKILEDGPWHRLFLDILLPDMTGFEIVKRVRQESNFSSEKIILMSALSSDRTIQSQIEESGIENFWPKPFQDLQEIRRWLPTGLQVP